MKQQQGFSLIEVAISIFILSVGLLGLASLQFMSLKNMEMAQRSDSANTYVQQIAEAMRSNKSSLAVFVDGSGDVRGSYDISCTNACTNANAAEAELNRIKNAILKRFDGASLAITRDSTLGTYTLDGETKTIGIYTVELTWEDPGSFILRDDITDADKVITQRQSLKVVL